MADTTTQIQICNRAAQLLGAQAISSIQENSRTARALNRAYQPVMLAELRKNFWGFSIMRAVLAASATKPAFGPSNYFPLPANFIMLAPPDNSGAATFGGTVGYNTGFGPQGNQGLPNDWQIENGGPGVGPAIVTNDPAPLYIRFVSSAITESMFDVLFAEALSGALACDTCEEITQSNTKLASAEAFYTDTMERAKQRNAYEKPPILAPTDSYILARY